MRGHDLAAAALVALFAGLAADTARRSSAIADEVAHLPAGYTYVRTGDMRLNPQHPPLAKALAGLPLLALDLEPVARSPQWHASREWDFGREFLTRNREPLPRLLFWGRLPLILLGAAGGAVLWLWARALWGVRPALGALALYALCPNLIAHTGVVATDLALAVFTLAAVASAWRGARTGRLGPWWAAGALLGLALLAKYSAVVTVALLLVLAAIAAASGPGDWRGRARAFAARAAALALPAALLASLAFPDGLAGYARGYALIHADSNPHFQPFLWGEHAPGGFWYYYLLAQWWKTPPPALLLFAAALIVALRAGGRRERLDWLFVLLPIVAFHAAAAVKHPSIGIRHVLPALPFLYLACGGALVRTTTRARRWTCAALGAWLLAGALATHPLELSYFNELAGGPEGGIRYLGDSDVDWGQDYWRLSGLLAERFPGPVRLSALTPLPPAAYGIDAGAMTLRDLVLPEPGITYVVGAAQLQAETLYFGFPGIRLDWLERYRPVARAGVSLLVFRFALAPGQGDAVALPPDRRAQAIGRLRQIAARHPGFIPARDLLAEWTARP